MPESRGVRVGLTLGLVGLAAVLVSADTLVMRDGRRIIGELVSVRNGVIEFREQGGFSGRPLRVSRDEVRRIEIDADDVVRPDERPGRETGGRPGGLREREVAVQAAQPWSDTGVDVRVGQMVYFSARGRVVWGPDRTDGPAGENGSPRNPGRPIPNRPAASLIGRIGESSTDYFFIGDDQGAMRMRASGRLFLGINDDYLRDNRGAFRVTVYY